MSECEKCVEYVEQTKKVLQERAIDFDAAQRDEREARIRDAVKGNDMWSDIHREIENNLLFLMQRYLPEDDPEQTACDGVDQQPFTISGETNRPSNTETTKMEVESKSTSTDENPAQPAGESGRSDSKLVEPTPTSGQGWRVQQGKNRKLSTLQKNWIETIVPRNLGKLPDPPSAPPTPTPAKSAPSPSMEQEQDSSENSEKNSYGCELPTTPEAGSSSPIMPKDSPTVGDSSDLDEMTPVESSTVDDSEEDDSVVQKEAKKSKRTLRPAPSREYNLRRRSSAASNEANATQEMLEGEGSGGEAVAAPDSEDESINGE